MSKISIYPAEPDRPAPKPELLPGRAPDPYPENSMWLSHDPAVYHDPNSGNYYLYCTDALCWRSPDLVRWTRLGKIVDEPPKEAFDHVGTKNIWAPDIVKVGDEYRLYCSNSSFGSQRSCIFLAVADNAEGPFIPRGIVVKTDESCDINAIDANIIEDAKTGEQYMVFGSFWDGVRIIKLNKETGLAAEDGLGIPLAKRPPWFSGGIEGPYVIYNPDTDYYYLFVSYGSLNSDYNIRVGRSRSVTGPYTDYNGREMTDLTDSDASVGYMAACGYAFSPGTMYMAPGHNSVLHDFDDSWYIVHHIREKNFKGPEPSLAHIRKVLWSDDGWPLVSPEIYSGEKVQPADEEDLIGRYERLYLTPGVPQGTIMSTTMELRPDHTAAMGISVLGFWELTDEYTLKIHIGSSLETYKFCPAWDYELWKPTLILTGMDNRGIAIWSKKF